LTRGPLELEKGMPRVVQVESPLLLLLDLPIAVLLRVIE
jgi:hypothetical protein